MIYLLAIDWSNVALQAGQLLLALSLLVILHEFGHYITARWFKCRVEKFFLFFDPWFAIAKKKIGDTVYGIGWLPLGGYVKISGMIDESMDKEALKQPPIVGVQKQTGLAKIDSDAGWCYYEYTGGIYYLCVHFDDMGRKKNSYSFNEVWSTYR